MAEHEATRTLVKSAPELWAECSDAASLARHLGRFGEIRITKLEPETAVAWEGDDVSGTVRLEPSGWGTRVTLTASAETGRRPAVEEAAPAVLPAPEVPDPPAVGESEVMPAARESEVIPELASPPPQSFLARLLGRLRVGEAAAEIVVTPVVPEKPAGAEASPPPKPSPPPARATPPRVSVLVDALESLGMAHHRPYSRS